MTYLVPIALFGWIPVVLMFFVLLPPRRAVITAFLLGWLFLPNAGYQFEGLPDYTKISATSTGVLLAAILFDPGRLLAFRPRLVDLPMVIWCICPVFSTISNEIGGTLTNALYGGATGALSQIFTWGLPYLIGRIYFSDLDGLRELAIGIFIGGLIYVPLCLYEIRMSPQLHLNLYGFHPTAFAKTHRWGGFRPWVFMNDGLALGMWMTAASLIGVWLWRTGAMRRLRGIPMSLLVPILLVVTVLCKATGALALLALGIGVLFALKWTGRRFGIVLLVAAAPLYMTLRATDVWSGEGLVDAARVIGEDRARSLEGRMRNEDLLTDRALQRPIFGWSGWNRMRVRDEQGRIRTTPDGLWVVALGQHGIVGLTSVTLVFLLPSVLLTRRYPAASWLSPALAAPVALVVLLALQMLDGLFNAMPNPIFMLAAGGTIGLKGGLQSLTRVAGARPPADNRPALEHGHSWLVSSPPKRISTTEPF